MWSLVLFAGLLQPGTYTASLGLIWNRMAADGHTYPGMAVSVYPWTFGEGWGLRLGVHSANLYRRDVWYGLIPGEERLDGMLLDLGIAREYRFSQVSVFPALSVGWADLVYAENSARHPGFYLGYGGDLTTIRKSTVGLELSVEVLFGPLFTWKNASYVLGLMGSYSYAPSLEIVPGVQADLRHASIGVLVGARVSP